MLLLLQLPHDQGDELNVRVPHGSANLVWSRTLRPHSLAIGWLFWYLPVVLVNLLKQLRPVQVTNFDETSQRFNCEAEL